MRKSIDMPMVSVVLCTFNRADLLPRAVQSVLGQDYADLELIIVDDASTDGTEALVGSFEDERIVYSRNDTNIGAAASRNRGIDLARGEFVAFQDSDDVWLPGKLSRQVEALADRTVPYGACFSSFLRISPAGVRLVPDKDPGSGRGDLFARLLRGNFINLPTLLVRKDCLEEVGAMDDRFPRLIDWDLALRLAREYPVLFCREPLLLSFHTGSSITENVDAYIESVALILSKYAEDYKARWLLVVNHYLFNAKYLARNGRYGQALEYLVKALGVPLHRLLAGEAVIP